MSSIIETTGPEGQPVVLFKPFHGVDAAVQEAPCIHCPRIDVRPCGRVCEDAATRAGFGHVRNGYYMAKTERWIEYRITGVWRQKD
jgi:hypothetical protein